MLSYISAHEVNYVLRKLEIDAFNGGVGNVDIYLQISSKMLVF